MEPSTRFDIEQSIQTWRSQMAQSPSLGAGDLKELEAHMRDSCESLQSVGLSSEESWLIAQHRLGARPLLENEYDKTHPERLWTQRLLWMVAGFVLIGMVQSLSYMGGQVTPMLLSGLVGRHVMGLISVVLQAVFLVLGFVFIWKSGQSGRGWIHGCVRWMRSRPVQAGVVVVVLLLLFQAGIMTFNVVASRLMQAQLVGTMAMWYFMVGTVLNVILWPVVLVLLLKRNQEGTASLD